MKYISFKKLMPACINGAINPIEPHHLCPKLVVCHSALNYIRKYPEGPEQILKICLVTFLLSLFAELRTQLLDAMFKVMLVRKNLSLKMILCCASARSGSVVPLVHDIN